MVKLKDSAAVASALNGNRDADAFVEHMQLCTAHMQDQKEIDLILDYKVYHSHASKTAAETAHGRYWRKGKNSYYQLMGHTFVQNAELLVAIDDSSQQVLVQKAGALIDPVKTFINTQHLKRFATSVKSEKADGVIYYLLEVKDAQIKTIGISLDLKRKMVQRIDLFYAHETEIIEPSGNKTRVLPRMEISYEQASQKSSHQFSVEKIIKGSKKRFLLTPAYQKYTLTDHYHQKNK